MNAAKVITPDQALLTRSVNRVPRYLWRLVIYASLAAADLTAIALGFFSAQFIGKAQYLSAEGIMLIWLVIPTYLLLATNNGSYAIGTLRNRVESLRRPVTALVTAAMLVILYTFLTKSSVQVSRVAFTTAILFSVMAIVVGRLLVDYLVVMALKRRLTDELLIVDDGFVPPLCSSATMAILDASQMGLRPDINDPAMLVRLAMIVRNYDRVVVTAPRDRQADWSFVLKGAGVVGEVLLREHNRLGAIGVGELEGHDTIIVSRGPLSLPNRIKKRLLDLALAVPMLILTGPLLAIVAILIKLESPGPVLFKQQRVGQSNSMFQILKFRSMRMNTEGEDGSVSTQRDDDRITRVGKFIRATSIDELPQLINVLRGDMSIVGPRPHALGSRAGEQLFWHVNNHYWLRHTLRPGITGLAQIRGFRGATHRKEDLEDRLQADLEYVNGWRLSRDLTILLGTIRVLLHRNAY